MAAHPATAPRKSTKGAQAQLSWVGVNVARVVQSIVPSGSGWAQATACGMQAFKVANTPVVVEAPSEPQLRVTAAVGPGFTLEVETDADVWSVAADGRPGRRGPGGALTRRDPEAGVVSFGSGLRGMRPPLGRGIRAHL